jgi:BirA family biotin operon repressor/biotin-[acetyl-CoA-carboxylase] ligase
VAARAVTVTVTDRESPFNGRLLARAAGLAEVRVFARLGSTNTRAAELARAGALALPAAVLASRQTAGRGRGSNRWHSDAGTLTVSFVRAASPEVPPYVLPLRVGLAVRRAAAAFADESRLRVKWPNDVLADGRKLAGVLCLRVATPSGEADIIGVGLNVSTDFSAEGVPAEVRRRAVALRDITTPPTRAVAFAELARCLEEELSGGRGDAWRADFDSVHALSGRTVAVDTGGEVVRGTCSGIDDDGRLLLHGTEGGLRTVASGHVLG